MAAGQKQNRKNRSGGAGRKRGVGKMNSRPALAAAEKILRFYCFYSSIKQMLICIK
jgi:hypothetical protein